MTDRDADQDDAWERHRDEQRRAWLKLTPADRLAWLAQAKDFCRLGLGAATREPKKIGPDSK